MREGKSKNNGDLTVARNQYSIAHVGSSKVIQLPGGVRSESNNTGYISYRRAQQLLRAYCYAGSVDLTFVQPNLWSHSKTTACARYW